MTRKYIVTFNDALKGWKEDADELERKWGAEELEQEPCDALHTEREQAYMQGYEDASKKYRQEPCEDWHDVQSDEMTLDEAIKHAEEVMMNNLDRTKGRNASDTVTIYCFKCAEEHRQLAGWLKELKGLRARPKGGGNNSENDQ